MTAIATVPNPSKVGDIMTKLKADLIAKGMTEADATIEHISVDEKDAFTSIVDVVLTVRDRIHLADILKRARGLRQVRRIYRVKN